MSYNLYQFEAVFIQDYILSGGKIKTMVGASEIIEAITNQLLDEAVEKLGLKIKKIDKLPEKGELNLLDNEVVFPRRAGAVFMMITHNEKAAQDFAKLWPILVSNFAPGLRFSAAMDSDENLAEAAKKVRRKLNDQKNQPQTFLPESTPLTVRFQKTGLAQVEAPAGTKKDGADWTMQAKLSHCFKSLADKHIDKKDQSFKGKQFVFPQQFEHRHTKEYWRESFPFKTTDPGNHSIAIIHTDGNGLGLYVQKIFAGLSKLTAAEYIHGYAEFSQGLDVATQKAAQQATHWLIQHYQQEETPYKVEIKDENVLPLPMRPLILGGDDLTCIVRADYALGFINAFTEAFEQQTTDFLKGLEALKDVLPERLTCTTGMIFIKSNQPFSLAYKLAEELCSTAKKAGQKISAQQNSDKPMPPSLIYFLHTTNTLFDELDVQLDQELKTSDDKCLSLCPYAFQAEQERPVLNQLFELKACFDKDKDDQLNPSAVRNYAGHLHQDPHYAETFWNRWQKLVGDDKAKTRQAWSSFEALWSQMTDKNEDPNHLPVADLLSLFALDIKDPNSTPKTEATI
ncbi:MAG: hypothetical protein GW898_03455 [Thiomicrospira sp.]|nr:hypothetical protein [Thiomicrospira sp.]NCO13423.1 hypothetical protein [Thiomicrospira sp.]NCO81789.1 hypothetical protein [Thiomicrospira sp.]NCS63301.1 hypothetical protein [Thiomicrospira sp.]OIP94698.1 MAG: hypothetical protein AUK56_07775 [Thiomicrospira sp. CG2_30_44_34]